MNFLPYRVNLTPFASLFDDGQPHTVALSVFNADSYFFRHRFAPALSRFWLYSNHRSPYRKHARRSRAQYY